MRRFKSNWWGKSIDKDFYIRIAKPIPSLELASSKIKDKILLVKIPTFPIKLCQRKFEFPLNKLIILLVRCGAHLWLTSALALALAESDDVWLTTASYTFYRFESRYLVCKGVFNDLLLSKIRELKSLKLEKGLESLTNLGLLLTF